VQLLQPTAHALLADVAATPKRMLPAGLGLGIRFQAAPFQCAISVWPAAAEPTAQASWVDVAATARKMPRLANEAAGPAGQDLAAAASAAPAAVTANTSGIANSATGRVANWRMRTACHSL
jgi:hypothetical protein